MERNTQVFFNRKASVLDIFPIMVIILAVIITSVIAYIIWDKVNFSQVFHDDANANATMQITERTILNFDNLIVMIFIVLSMVTIVAASQLQNNPAWFFIALVILCIAFVVGVSFSNVYEKLADSTHLSSAADQFPKTRFMFDKLPIYVVLMLFSIMVAMYIGYKVFA